MPGLTPKQLFERGKEKLAGGLRKYAHTLFRKALKEGKRALNDGLKAELLIALAKIDRDRGWKEDARVHYGMAAQIIRGLDKPLALAHTLRHEADILREQKKVCEAEAIYNDVLALYRTNPDHRPLDLANALRGYALLKARIGDVRASIQLWQEAGAIYESLGLEAGVAESRAQITVLSVQ